MARNTQIYGNAMDDLPPESIQPPTIEEELKIYNGIREQTKQFKKEGRKFIWEIPDDYE